MTVTSHRAEGRRGSAAATALDSPRVLVVLVVMAVVLTVGALAMGVASAWPVDHCVPVGQPGRLDGDPLPRSEPVAIAVDGIDACSSLIPVGVDAQRRIEVPSVLTPMQAGWYRFGPTPGQRGPAVVVGHVNGGGQEGVFAHLDDVERGDRITVTRRDGVTAFFAVTGMVQVPKDGFPTPSVYGDTDGAELRLITCGGALDRTRHDYADNVIVFAELVGTG